MDMDNSKVGYGRLLGEGSKLQYAGNERRPSFKNDVMI